MKPSLVAAPAAVRSDAPADGGSSELDRVMLPAREAVVTLTSGRRYELEAGADADRLVVRGARGAVVLRIEITDRGPLLSFDAAEIALSATKRIALEADRIDLVARGDMRVATGGDLDEHVGGHHHVRVEGDERLEASNVELQAESGKVEVVAMREVRLDGEHIGLNDKPVPVPFPWSKLAAEDETGTLPVD